MYLVITRMQVIPYSVHTKSVHTFRSHTGLVLVSTVLQVNTAWQCHYKNELRVCYTSNDQTNHTARRSLRHWFLTVAPAALNSKTGMYPLWVETLLAWKNFLFSIWK